jgi:circadian clock protein KaiB
MDPRPGLRLRLFVAADSPDSVTAMANLKALFPKEKGSDVHIDIVDVQREPGRAARDEIMVTPTLLRVSPSPRFRILGNLTNGDALLRLLGVARPRLDPTS